MIVTLLQFTTLSNPGGALPDSAGTLADAAQDWTRPMQAPIIPPADAARPYALDRSVTGRYAPRAKRQIAAGQYERTRCGRA